MLQGAGRNLIPYLTPVDNIRYAQRAASRGRELPSPGDVLALVGLQDHRTTPLTSLTPGQIQLCAVAVGIATYPGLLLADEPTSQLDHQARDEVLNAIRTINAETGMTVLLITHDPEVAAVSPDHHDPGRANRVGGTAGEEYAVVATDGSLPLPPHVAELLPAGTLVQVTTDDGEIRLTPVEQEGPR